MRPLRRQRCHMMYQDMRSLQFRIHVVQPCLDDLYCRPDCLCLAEQNIPANRDAGVQQSNT